MKKLVLALLFVSTLAQANYDAKPLSTPKGGSGDASFTANLPILGNGASSLIQGTVSGNTTEFGTVSGALVSTHCLKADAGGNIVDSGAACSSTSGTVTSVALADGSTSPIFTISGSPVTGSGTLTETLSNQNSNLVLAGPSSGAAAQPNFRALVYADLPPMGITNGGNAAYAILASDQHVRSGTALTANRTYTLPACAANIGERHEVKNLASQGFNVILAANGVDTIDGAANQTLLPGDSMPVVCAVSGTWDIQ